MLNQTIVRRSIIIAIFLLILAVTFFASYEIFGSDPTCTDKKQNQNEKGVDCGGPCTPCLNKQAQNILIEETAVVPGGRNTYDAVAKIYNPNDKLGAKSFKYTFNLKDENGNTVASKEGSDFILPIDNKYVVSLGIETAGNAVPRSAELVIGEAEWTPLQGIEKPQIQVVRKTIEDAPMGEGKEAAGMIRNESQYDLNKITLSIILRNSENKIIGVNKTEKSGVRVKEQRDFKLNWPYALPGTVQRVEVDAQSNVLDPQNFTL